MSTAVMIRLQIAIAAAKQERGAALAEYGLLLALVSLAAISILIAFGGEIAEVFTNAEQTLNNRGTVTAD